MAGIDYSIPGQIRPIQVESPINAMSQALQLRGLYDTSQMNALKLEEARRDVQERNALAKLDPTSAEYLTQLKRVNPKLALEYQKSGLEAESAKIKKQKDEAELFQAELKKSRYFLEGIDPNSPTAAQEYKAWHEANHANPILNAELTKRGITKDAAYARIDAAIKSGSIKNLIAESKLGIDNFYQYMPAFEKAEKEQIDQRYSDYLNSLKPGEPALTRLQFIEMQNRQRPVAPAPDAAAPAPAPAPAAAVDLTNVPLANRSAMFNRPQGNQPPVNQPPVNQLGGFQTNAVNNLGVVPTATTAANRAVPVATERPAIAPNAARLMKSNLKSDQDAAVIIQRAWENDAKLTDKERDFAAAVDAGFKGNYVQYQDQLRETEAEREYRRAKEDGSFKGTFLEWKREMAKATKIVLQPAPSAKPTDTALDMLAYQYIKDSGTITQMPKQLRTAIVNRAAELMGGSAENMAGDITTNRQDTAAAKAAVKDFTSGKSAVATRSFNTAIDHLETMEKLAIALQNNDMRLFNSIGNFFAKQTGTAAPANFDAARAIVGGEVAKALTGANMALKDREEIRDAIIASSSPQQLIGVLKTFKQLLGGQLNSLNIQYQTSTGRDDFRNKLSPASKRELDALNPQAPARSSNARQTPAPPAVGEIRDGHKFKGGNPADAKNWEKVK
jgi:hypothetical protein